MSKRVLAALLLAAALLTTPLTVQGEDLQAANAELVRLQDEIEKLASRNQWNGVERTYGKIVTLKEEQPDIKIEADYHIIGSQAASQRGDITAAHRRLVHAIPEYKQADPSTVSGARQTALQTIAAIESRYGHVVIKVSSDRVPVLVRFEMPFTREERKAIEYGRETLANSRSLDGFLPVGRYMVDGQFFTVAAGGVTQSINVGKFADDG